MRLDKSKVASLVRTDFGHQMLAEGDRAQAGNPEKEQVWMLLVDEIDPDPLQPRQRFDDAPLNDLAADIARRGVLQPILVRSEGNRYRIIVGERRWRASKLAGKARIPCLIREFSDSDIRQAQLVENVVREDISDVERGRALRQLYESLKAENRKITWEDVARMVGLSRMRINHLYSLSSLPAPIIELIQTRRLSGSHGVELARLEAQPEIQRKLAEDACRPETGEGTYRVSVATLRDQINALLGAPTQTGGKRLSKTQIEDYGRSLMRSLRPDLSHETREHLRDMAQHILRFLDQEEETKHTKMKVAETKASDKNSKIVKSTLQKPDDPTQTHPRQSTDISSESEGH